MFIRKELLAAAVVFCLVTPGCKSLMNSQRGNLLGTAGGEAIGAIIGKASGNSAMGAMMGATVGGVTGEVIGKKMDGQAEEISKLVPGAKVERVGEGILVEFKSKILFGAGDADLSRNSETSITELANVLNKYQDTNIEIRGHTDNKGKESYNQTLSDRRANAVASYLRSKGIAPERIRTKGFGETMPKSPNDSEAGRSENRRVEFLILANEKMKEDARKESAK
jgi:outer membrane protein OmpA-like peptidoglycan-associated protein